MKAAEQLVKQNRLFNTRRWHDGAAISSDQCRAPEYRQVLSSKGANMKYIQKNSGQKQASFAK